VYILVSWACLFVFMHSIHKQRHTDGGAEHKVAMQKMRLGFVGEKRVPNREVRDQKAELAMSRFTEWVGMESANPGSVTHREPLVHEHSFRDRDLIKELHTNDWGFGYEREKARCERLATQHQGEMLQREAWYRNQHHDRAPPNDLIHTPVRARMRTRDFTDGERVSEAIDHHNVTGSQAGPHQPYNPCLFQFRPQEPRGRDGRPRSLKKLDHELPESGPWSLPASPLSAREPYIDIGQHTILNKDLPSPRASAPASPRNLKRFSCSMSPPKPAREDPEHRTHRYRNTLQNVACGVPHMSTTTFFGDHKTKDWAMSLTTPPRGQLAQRALQTKSSSRGFREGIS